MTYLCNDCGHEFEEPKELYNSRDELVFIGCPKSDCASIDIVYLSEKYLKEQAELAKADEDYDSKAIKEHYDD